MQSLNDFYLGLESNSAFKNKAANMLGGEKVIQFGTSGLRDGMEPGFDKINNATIKLATQVLHNH